MVRPYNLLITLAIFLTGSEALFDIFNGLFENAFNYGFTQTPIKLKRILEIVPSYTKEVVYTERKPIEDQYDFIVVGASPSGCVITNRLTEDLDTDVLLLEAGREDNVLLDIPVLNSYTPLTSFNWAYETESTGDTCLGMNYQRCPWPSGKGVGGGTLLNAMIWTRGNHRDFDSWAAEGNPGWSYSELLPYFKKSEKTILEGINTDYQGKNGNLNIEYVPFVTPLLKAFVEAGKTLGYKEVNYNNPNTHIGFARIQATVRNGERISAGTAFLKPILRRSNLQVSVRSRVVKILIDPSSRKAVGVIYLKHGQERKVFAKKEVILAAGAFGSPHLLMLSGVGHAQHLTEKGIPVVQDLPVGDNLMEHPGMHGLSFLINKPDSLSPLRTANNLQNILDYVFLSEGPGTSLGCEGISYVKTKYSNTTEDYPDIELLFIATGMNTDEGLLLRKSFGISDELYDYTYWPYDYLDAFSIWPMLLYPQSRGFVRLKDNNPLSKPIIDHGFFTAGNDLEILVEGIKIAVELAQTPSFQEFSAKLIKVPFPTCRNISFGTDDYWRCAVRTMTTQFHHQSGTCKMGTVVDSRLRVFGLDNLRVADASIMPTITGGHTQSPAYAIGEKAADLIKEDWGL